MTHSVYISLGEYLDNGGIAEDMMQVYTTVKGLAYQAIGWIEKSKQVANPHVVMVSQSDRTFQCNFELVYVKVECTPIYKAI